MPPTPVVAYAAMATCDDERRDSEHSADRRRFLARTAQAAGSVSLVGLLLGSYGEQARSHPISAIRPPGAINEQDFLGACVRCGLCVRDCPFDTLRLARFGESLATGTPYFVAREIPCEMCEDIPCAAACPTDALTKSLIDIRAADMGSRSSPASTRATALPAWPIAPRVTSPVRSRTTRSRWK